MMNRATRFVNSGPRGAQPEDMNMKINTNSQDAIREALNAVNGGATAHTYHMQDMLTLTRSADRALDAILPRGMHKGARYNAESGDRLSNSYQHKRKTTVVLLERGARDWFLIDAWSSERWREAGKETLLLTPAQDAEAKARFARRYSVMP